MDREDIVAITDYLTKGVYPDGLSKVEKRSMRKKCTAFLSVDGVLYHKGKAGRRRLVVTDLAERRRIISKMHENSNGKAPHNGINITLRKVVDWYWWRKITEDVKHFCRSCAECSRLFALNRGVDSVPEFNNELRLRQEEVDAQLQFESSVVVAAAAELKELSWSFYSSELLSALHEMYKQKVCCDIILSAGGFQVSTHKVILMATSDFLKSLITDHESGIEAIHLTDVCGLCLEPMISFLYTGSLKLSQDNVLIMMSTANQLGIASAVSLCRQFLENGDDAKVASVKVLSEKPSVNDNNDCSENMSSVRFDNVDQGVASPQTTESANCAHDETVILGIKEEISNASFLVSEDIKDFVPFVIPTRNQLKTKRQQKERLQNGLSDGSWISNGKQSYGTDAQQKRYNTRSVAMHDLLQKSADSKVSMPRSKLGKTKELQKSRRRAMIKLLLETHGRRHSCYVCESNFRYSSGLAHHLVQRHRIPRLDLALFRLSQISIRCAIKFQRRRHCGIVENSYRDLRSSSSRSNKTPLKTRPISERQNFVRPFWRRRFYSTWCSLVKIEQQKCRSNNDSSCGAAPALVFRNRCGWCAKTFLRRADLLDHRQQVHKKRNEFSTSGDAAVREKRVRHDWTCKEKGCGTQLTTKESLRDHMATAHPTLFLSCPKCRYKTQVEHYLKRHLVRRHKDRHLCPHCSRPYHKRSLLKIHMYNQHKVEDPTLQLHRCPHDGCSYACPGKSALQTHMLKHTIAKLFTCHICGKDFKRALSLDKHINNVHLGIRSYVCDKCGATCCDEADLKRHLLKHEKNKTHSCSICSFSTFHKVVFQSHMFSRHQIVDEKMRLMRCDQCSFVTNKKYRYNDHVKMHRNIRDIPCPECGKPFVTRKTMRQHVVKVHKQTTQCCHLCSFKTLTVKKLQEHVDLMHNDDRCLSSPPAQSCSSSGAAAALAPTGVDAGAASYPPAVLSDVAPPPPSTRLSGVCGVSSFVDVGVTLRPAAVGLSSFPIVQSALLVDNCVVNDFQEMLQPPVSCDMSSIQLQLLDNGYLPYDPCVVGDQSMG